LKEVDYEQLTREFAFKHTDDFFAAIGYGRLSVNQVIHKIVPEEQKKEEHKEFVPKKKQEGSSVVVKGVENLLIRFARCCRPIPGDDIVGYISRGKGIMVHRGNCPYVSEIDPQRLIPVEWDKGVSESHEIEFSVICQDKPGMLGSMTAIVGAHNINITKLNAYSMPEGNSMCVFRVMVKDLSELEKLFISIKKLKGVERIERV
jgi:GTP pyrophosphokinase